MTKTTTTAGRCTRYGIAIGKEALAYADARGFDVRRDEPWARMYLQRNVLAHRRPPDIDEDRVWRDTALLADDVLYEEFPNRMLTRLDPAASGERLALGGRRTIV